MSSEPMVTILKILKEHNRGVDRGQVVFESPLNA